jgi:hypothetical protein
MKVKSLVATFVTALVGAGAAVGQAASGGGGVHDGALLLIGPVEAVNSIQTRAVVLGQKISITPSEGIAVGSTVAVYGTESADGTITATKVVSEGLYVPGASSVFLVGVVQKVQSSVGHVVVNGLTVDLTSVMAQGTVSVAVGTQVTVAGTQSVGHGLVTANGISGGGVTANGISGGGLNANGISGGGLSANGISGGGLSANGISGGGRSANGISGGGLSASGISGGGLSANGISGGGLSASGISGGGLSANGISGGGLHTNGISGGGR